MAAGLTAGLTAGLAAGSDISPVSVCPLSLSPSLSLALLSTTKKSPLNKGPWQREKFLRRHISPEQVGQVLGPLPGKPRCVQGHHGSLCAQSQSFTGTPELQNWLFDLFWKQDLGYTCSGSSWTKTFTSITTTTTNNTNNNSEIISQSGQQITYFKGKCKVLTDMYTLWIAILSTEDRAQIIVWSSFELLLCEAIHSSCCPEEVNVFIHIQKTDKWVWLNNKRATVMSDF